ncbi:KRI1-like family C-terminal-domain-containing protein [Rhodofomes roseus]|uniref:KRI1-like family C-terminal-domain-containing protein n=1 Tax=Rhodofomes roseus TaxID=34475 RepID=A0ABQ8K919_9APHY|nr:KRI1-like family C-terminal-domain-containing protein [Rhodofomes roseus]KAH9833455.1 KRI1-like family C-terminal-domain-containing protein [Rhodofomes roseus]
MLSDESENEGINQLTINEHFAKAFEYRKEREELAKLKEKYGSDAEEDGVDEDDSEDESEDEDGEELTPAVDAAILRTLLRIRKKDPAIYEGGKDIFEEERQKTGNAAPVTRAPKDKSKPLTMRQHALASALNPSSRSPSPEPLTHVAEQAALRKETISAFHDAVSRPKEEDEDDGFLVPREKTKDETEREEEEYRQFLEREVGADLKEIVTLDTGTAGGGEEAEPEPEPEPEVKEEGKEKSKKKKKKEEAKGKGKGKESKEEQDQEFLINYILNRGWIDHASRRLPTYKEIVGSKSKKGKKSKGKAKDGGSSSSSASASDAEDIKSEGEHGAVSGGEEIDEDEFDDVADRFESSYNFRFEEPGADTIARYPRNIDSLVRRQDTSRKEARENRKARKEEELLKKREEVKRLKSLKMKDLQVRLEMISKEGGKALASDALQELDLEGDWDPDAHDRQMAELYERDADDDALDDDDKPTWDDIDITDIVPPEEESDEEASSSKKKKKKKKKKDEGGVDEGGVDIDEMDAAVERGPVDEEEWDGTEEMRKQVLEKYMDELYGLEFNDMVGDMPTRFKYARVAPQTFGLSATEILMATDAELNQFMGVKKLAPYRKEGKGKTWDGQRTARLKELKDKLKDRGIVLGEGGADRDRTEKPKKRKGKKERMREKVTAAGGDAEAGEAAGGAEDGYDSADVEKEAGRKAKRRKVDEEDGRMDSVKNGDGQDESTRKKRRRHKKSHHGVTVDGEA